MAQILKINELTYHVGINGIGDVVGVFEDTHKFSITELNIFDIEKVIGSVETVKMLINAVLPRMSRVYKASTTGWTETKPKEKEVWEDIETKELSILEDQPKYLVSLIDGKFAENITRNTVNNVKLSTLSEEKI